MFTEVILVLVIKERTQDANYVTIAVKSVAYRLIHEVVYIVCNLCLDISILSLYIYGLHVYATYWNGKSHKEYKEVKDTERTHELLKIVTRFVISFGWSMIFDLIAVTLNAIYYYHVRDNKSLTEEELLMWRILVNLGNIANDTSFMVSVYFSHEFGHRMYERVCCILDGTVNRYCIKINRDRTENIGFEYQRMVSPLTPVQSDNEML